MYKILVDALHQECYFDSSHPRTREGMGRAIVRTLSLIADSDTPEATAMELLEEWKRVLSMTGY